MLHAIGTLPSYSDVRTSYLANHPPTYCPSCQPASFNDNEAFKTQQKMNVDFSKHAGSDLSQGTGVVARGSNAEGTKPYILPLALPRQSSGTDRFYSPEILPRFGLEGRGSPANSPRPELLQPLPIHSQAYPAEIMSLLSFFSFG